MQAHLSPFSFFGPNQPTWAHVGPQSPHWPMEAHVGPQSSHRPMEAHETHNGHNGLTYISSYLIYQSLAYFSKIKPISINYQSFSLQNNQNFTTQPTEPISSSLGQPATKFTSNSATQLEPHWASRSEQLRPSDQPPPAAFGSPSILPAAKGTGGQPLERLSGLLFDWSVI